MNPQNIKTPAGYCCPDASKPQETVNCNKVRLKVSYGHKTEWVNLPWLVACIATLLNLHEKCASIVADILASGEAPINDPCLNELTAFGKWVSICEHWTGVSTASVTPAFDLTVVKDFCAMVVVWNGLTIPYGGTGSQGSTSEYYWDVVGSDITVFSRASGQPIALDTDCLVYITGLVLVDLDCLAGTGGTKEQQKAATQSKVPVPEQLETERLVTGDIKALKGIFPATLSKIESLGYTLESLAIEDAKVLQGKMGGKSKLKTIKGWINQAQELIKI